MSGKISAPEAPGGGPTAGPARTRGWVKVLLAVSLALNLGVAGLAAGAWLGHEKGGGSRRDSGLGPLASAMTREDWRAMRPAWVSRNPDLGRGEAALRADYDPLLAALRTEPFEVAALHEALTRISESNARRLSAAREVIGGYLASLDEGARMAYADRLEAALNRAKPGAKPAAGE